MTAKSAKDMRTEKDEPRRQDDLLGCVVHESARRLLILNTN